MANFTMDVKGELSIKNNLHLYPFRFRKNVAKNLGNLWPLLVFWYKFLKAVSNKRATVKLLGQIIGPHKKEHKAEGALTIVYIAVTHAWNFIVERARPF